jgi:hypothetical protein
MGLRNLLRENDLNGFEEGLALSDTATQKIKTHGYPFLLFLLKGFLKVLTGPFTTVMDGRWHLDGGYHRVGVSSITVAEPYGGDWEQYIYEASRSCK